MATQKFKITNVTLIMLQLYNTLSCPRLFFFIFGIMESEYDVSFYLFNALILGKVFYLEDAYGKLSSMNYFFPSVCMYTYIHTYGGVEDFSEIDVGISGAINTIYTFHLFSLFCVLTSHMVWRIFPWPIMEMEIQDHRI